MIRTVFSFKHSNIRRLYAGINGSRVKNPMNPSEVTTKHLPIEARKRRLLLNSRNRGRLETELFLGGFATDRLWNMNEDEVNEYEAILNETDQDLYNWFCDISPVPEDIKNLKAWKEVIEYVASKRGDKQKETFKSDYNRSQSSQEGKDE
ncbi:SDH5 [Acrasis kona]|uniref:SDH5 n=1 Tax=Acrasis kona TaxID=1008807 RepID=A0AAW2YKK7_9EUKA